MSLLEEYYGLEHKISLGPLDLPVFLAGQSLGGLIALETALYYNKRAQGLLLLNPYLKEINQHPKYSKQ